MCVYVCVFRRLTLRPVFRIPPGIEKPEPPTTATEGVFEYTTKVKQFKKKHLGDRLHWNLNLIGRMPDRSDKGTSRAALWSASGKACVF